MSTTTPSGAPETGPPPTAPAAGARAALAFALLATVQLTLIAAITVIGIATPAIDRDFQLGHTGVALLNASYGLTFSSLLLLGGRLADLRGRRQTLILGLTVVAVASAAATLAPDLAMLLAARFAQGVGAAAAAPAAMGLLGVVYPDPARRVRATAIWGVLGSVGAVAGSLLAGAVVTWASWRWVFGLTFAVTAALAAASARLLPAGPRPAPARLDLPGAVLTVAALATLSHALLTAADTPWGSPRVLLPLAASALLLAGLLAVEARARQPLLPPAFLTTRGRLPALGVVLLTAGGMATTFLMLSLYLQQLRGWTPLAASAAFLAPALGLLAAGPVAGLLLGRADDPRSMTAAGLLVAAVGLGWLSLSIGSLHAALPPLLGGLVMLALGAGLTFSGATVTAMRAVPDHRAGLAGGLVNTAIEIGPPLGITLLLSLAAAHATRLAAAGGIDPAAATTGGYGHALRAAAATFALAGLITLTLRARDVATRQHPTTSTKHDETQKGSAA